MSEFINRIVSDDFVWTALMDHLPGQLRRSSTNFVNLSCPSCIRRGETLDRKRRCGIKRRSDGLVISCFNCGMRTGWAVGELLSKPLREFMSDLGMGEMEVKRLNHRAMQYRRMIESSPEAQAIVPITFNPNFPPAPLPEGARTIEEWAEDGCDDPDFLSAVEYAASRGADIWQSTAFYWAPAIPGSTHHLMNKRIIVPFIFNNAIVGWAARTFDNQVSPRYWSSAPTDFLFNSQALMRNDRKFVVVVEGVYDALAIDGVATLGAKMSDRQATWINNQGKRVIVVADRDSSGSRLIDVALKHGWGVAFPRLKPGTASRVGSNWWDQDIKDCAQAVNEYGRLYVLKSIIETVTNNKLEIGMKRKLVI